MNKERLAVLTVMILAAAASRLLPHPENVAPIAAIALFAGAQFERKWLAFAVPVAAMLMSDLFIGFYEGMWVTYLGFAVIVCLGFALRGSKGIIPVASATLTGSVFFFLISNCVFLIDHGLYPQTVDGMMQAYTAALPFFRNSLFGDAFYSALLFGGFALAQRKYEWLKVRPLATA
jgi:hypothetical protein